MPRAFAFSGRLETPNMPMTFEIPILYTNRGVPPRGQIEQDFTVLDTALFSFEAAEPYELEPALTLRTSREGASAPTEDRIVRQCRGQLGIDAVGRRQLARTPMDTAYLSGLAGTEPGSLADFLKVPASRLLYGHGRHHPAASLRRDRIVADGRAEAVADLQRRIDTELMIVGGRIFERVPDPRINVFVTREVYGVECSLLWSVQAFPFPCDRPDLVLAFTDWLESEHGLRSAHPHGQATSFVLDSPSVPLASNPVVAAALELASLAELDFAADLYGSHTKQSGLAFTLEPTVANAFAFSEAFEAAATAPGARSIGHGTMSAPLTFACHRKFAELMPAEYKTGYADTISIPNLP
jgi:hypothetical protein